LLLADFVLSLVLELSLRYSDTEIPTMTSRTVRRMSEGQLLEIKLRDKDKINWNDYFKIIDSKTASLFELSSRTGAILTTEDPYYIDAASEYGRNLGLVYQIYDDLRDWSKKEYVQKLDVDDIGNFLKGKIQYHMELSRNALKSLPESQARELLERFLNVIVKV
ncbi:MAG TPA: polyprenyl synthetase family protein, partial [Geobacterales bacterium]|nr:polyprenyl synthetase family protein [Geobacterales bacterium]